MESKIRDLRQEIFKFEQLSNFGKNDFFVNGDLTAQQGLFCLHQKVPLSKLLARSYL